MKKAFLTLVFMAFAMGATFAQSPVGKWKTVDDETGKQKSIVEIYEKDGKLYGKIVQLFRDPSENQDPLCDLCGDDRKNKKIIGMEIIRGMEKDGSEWEDGTILDPKKGKIYDCKFWLEGNDKLLLRGYVAFFYRTQTWTRVK